MRVAKFGGSSLATPDLIRDVGRIVLDEAKREPLILVVSAFQAVTNQLLDCARTAGRGQKSYEQGFEKIARRHRAAVEALVPERRQARIRARVDGMLGELRNAL